MVRTRQEVLQHLAKECFGYGNATGAKLRALKLSDRLRAASRRPDWRPDEQLEEEARQAIYDPESTFSEDMVRARKYLKKDDAEQHLASNAPEGDVKRVTAYIAFRLIRARGGRLPTRDEVIQLVEEQLVARKEYRRDELPFNKELERLRERRTKKQLHWSRILKELWLFDFLPVRPLKHPVKRR